MKKFNIKHNLGAFIEHLGEPEYYLGGHIYKWQCPYCQDTHRDNLVYDETKGVIWCFADETHAPKVLKDMLKSKKLRLEKVEEYKKKGDEEKKYCQISTPDKQAEFLDYMNDCKSNLLVREINLNYLLKHRGIKKETVDSLSMGYDFDRRLWVLPTIKYSTDGEDVVLGFEYRPLDFKNKKGIFRSKGTPTGLAMINSYTDRTEILVIVEGYFDGYVLWQHLDENNQADFYHIVTPSNGINSLLKYIPQINFDKYKKFYLFVDNDEAGNSAAEKIMAKYPMFERIILPCGCKDFNEHYLKCLHKAEF